MPIKWLTTKQAAEYLGYSYETMKGSRRKAGKLGGKDAPKFSKTGYCIRYDINDLDAWMGV